MLKSRKSLATIGLIFITFLAAIQYVFLQNVPDSVSEFSFLCITNAIGAILLGIVSIRKIRKLNLATIKKGAFFAIELTGFNFFLLLGSRNIDSVMCASIISLYFAFITPILLVLRKKINFFSGIATVIAMIALILMFGADVDALFSSMNVVYLIIADIFFATYVISVSVLGENAEPVALSFTQMLFGALFAFVGWFVQSLLGQATLAVPTDHKFWISALFIGIFIRVIYSVIQISAQRYVSALKTSLIFSSEIIITLITDPIMCRAFDKEYTVVTLFQIVGCGLFIIATLMTYDNVMSHLGYSNLDTVTYVDENGKKAKHTSVARRMISTTLYFSLFTLIFSTVVCLISIHFIRVSAVANSTKLGSEASETSMQAIMKELEKNMTNQVTDKALLAEQKMTAYSDSVLYAASYAHALYTDMNSYPDKEVDIPRKENAGIWVMQRTLANDQIKYEDVRDECKLLGNMLDVFGSIVQQQENIATIYIGTESGLLISYDPYSDTGDTVGEGYYEFRDANWYQLGKDSTSYAITDSYQDQYGRGLTITCVAPFTDGFGQFHGCIAVDVLMSTLNDSMVNDGVTKPSEAILIESSGNIIAEDSSHENTEDLGTIFNYSRSEELQKAGDIILANRNGIYKSGTDENSEYIAYATVDSLDWTLCIMTPVSTAVEPAVEIKANIDDNTSDVVDSVVQGILTVIQSCLALSALVLILVTMLAGRFSRRIADPLKKLEDDVNQISSGNLEHRSDVKTNDEIGSLATSFNNMTDSLQKYITDLKEMTAKEERLSMELSLASNIQSSMLPKDFDIFSSHKEFSLFASMNPAKEVGGDFYDFFMTDESHLVLVIADVSGKGIPAALFMAKAKTSIKTRAMMGGTPSEILRDVNVQMCEGNEQELFVTVWLAVIDIKTGKGIAANAGHEHPALCRASKEYELVIYPHSVVLAALETAKFNEHEFKLEPGDSLFVYTDGVPEATSGEENNFFGTERMLDALNKKPDAEPKEVIENVYNAVLEFSDGAEQFDDITMLCIKYNGNEGK